MMKSSGSTAKSEGNLLTGWARRLVEAATPSSAPPLVPDGEEGVLGSLKAAFVLPTRSPTDTPLERVIATRPINLSPKDTEDQKRHAKEYLEMMKSFKKKEVQEKKEKERREKARLTKEKRLIEARGVWRDEIIPQWDKLKGTRRITDLVWQGVPPSVRGQVWGLELGNNLKITQELFEILEAKSQRAKEEEMRKRKEQDEAFLRAFERKYGATKREDGGDENENENENGPNGDSTNETNSNGEPDPDEGEQGDSIWVMGKENTVSLIPLDLPRTFPCLSFFQVGGPSHAPLGQVLEAYVCYRPDIGYVQGMSYLAAVMLLYMDTFPAFRCLANLLNTPILVCFYRMDMTEIRKYVYVLDSIMAEHIPRTHNHLRSLDISTDLYIMDWILTLFSKALPLDIATRVWDNYFLRGDTFLYATITGLLSYLAPQLESGTFDECLQLLTHLPQDMDEAGLFDHINGVNVSAKRLEELLAEQGLEAS
jgi:hypothetical protein